MLAQTIGYLILTGIGHIPFLKAKYQKFFCFIGILITAVILYRLYTHASVVSGFAFEWLSIKNNQLIININSNLPNLLMVAPIFGAMLFVMLYNLIYVLEFDRVKINLLALFCGINLTLLVCAQDLIQLIIAASFSTVLGYTILNNVLARRKFVFYNLVADMALVMLAAMLRSQENITDIQMLGAISNSLAYPWVLGLLLMVFVWLKAGLFSLHNAVLDVHYVKSNRQMMVMYLTTPLAAIVSLYKLKFITDLSVEFELALEVLAGISLAWAIWAALIVNNIKKKQIYLNLMFFALMVALIANKSLTPQIFAFFMLESFLLNLLFVLVVNAASNETLVSLMGGFLRYLKTTFVCSVLASLVIIQRTLSLVTPENKCWVYAFLVAILIVTANLFREIYLGKTHADDNVTARLKNPNFLYFVPIFALAACLYVPGFYPPILALWAAGFVLVIVVPFLRPLEKFYAKENVQDSEFFYHLYDSMLMLPIRVLGRVLMITIDFLIIEKTIIASISKFNHVAVLAFQKIHGWSVMHYLVFSLLGLAIMFYCFYEVL